MCFSNLTHNYAFIRTCTGYDIALRSELNLIYSGSMTSQTVYHFPGLDIKDEDHLACCP